jgi:hypothetical protein
MHVHAERKCKINKETTKSKSLDLIWLRMERINVAELSLIIEPKKLCPIPWDGGSKFLGHAGSLFKYEELFEEKKYVEEVKMLSDKIDEPLFDLDKCIGMKSLIYCKVLLMILLLMFIKLVLDLT